MTTDQGQAREAQETRPMANEITAEQLAELRALLDDHKRLFAIKDSIAYLSAYAKWDAKAGRMLLSHLPALLSELERLQGLEARVKGAFIGYSEEDRGYMRAHRFVVGVPDSIGAGRRVALLALDDEGES